MTRSRRLHAPGGGVHTPVDGQLAAMVRRWLGQHDVSDDEQRMVWAWICEEMVSMASCVVATKIPSLCRSFAC
jgi:hypothetical protein